MHTLGEYTSCRHRVLAPEEGEERVGLPFLFRCRGEAIIDTREERRRAAAEGRETALAELQGSSVEDLPTADCPAALVNYMAWRRRYRS
jgi:isopenicillin N synthase-like dioxygenase